MSNKPPSLNIVKTKKKERRKQAIAVLPYISFNISSLVCIHVEHSAFLFCYLITVVLADIIFNCLLRMTIKVTTVVSRGQTTLNITMELYRMFSKSIFRCFKPSILIF